MTSLLVSLRASGAEFPLFVVVRGGSVLRSSCSVRHDEVKSLTRLDVHKVLVDTQSSRCLIETKPALFLLWRSCGSLEKLLLL